MHTRMNHEVYIIDSTISLIAMSYSYPLRGDHTGWPITTPPQYVSKPAKTATKNPS